MQQASTPASQLDDATLAFVRRVFRSARSGDTPAMAELLGQGLPPNLRNERGDSLLMLACYHGHADTARILLAHGADPEVRDADGLSPLAAAMRMGAAGTAALLSKAPPGTAAEQPA